MIALAAGLSLVGVTATGAAALLRPRGAVAFVLAAGVLAFAEIVAVSHALSFFDAYERTWLPGAVALLAIATVAAVVAVRPPWPSLRRADVVRHLFDDSVLAVLAAVVAAELVYLVALAAFTPPTEFDAVTYHLTRAVLWIQQGSVGPVEGVTDTRINEFPPDAEIVQGFTMLLSGSIRFVGLAQLASLAAAMLAIYGLATRLGLERRQAAFGALLFPTLTVVALQAPTALNDLVVGALVAVATFFALGRTTGEVALACITLALLIGTKSTGAFALPVLFVVCLLTYRGSRLLAVLGGGVVAVGVGAGWYAVNVAAGEGAFGGAGEATRGGTGIVPIAARATRYLVEAFELPVGGRDVLVYAIVAALLAAGGLVLRRRTLVVLVAASLAALPLVVPTLERVLHSVYWHGWTALGYPEATTFGTIRGYAAASNLRSWYGPLGPALCAVSLVLVARLVWRRELPWVALVLALAPIAYVLETAIALGYNPFDGRFVMGGVALSAATWGLVRSSPAGAVATVAVAATSVFLALAAFTERPSGLELLGGADRPSVWQLPREWSQSIQPEVSLVIGYVDEYAVPGDRIAVTRNLFVYPFAYVGWPDIEHRIEYADTLVEASRGDAAWALVADTSPCAPGWRLALDSPPWRLWRRDPDALCPPG